MRVYTSVTWAKVSGISVSAHETMFPVHLSGTGSTVKKGQNGISICLLVYFCMNLIRVLVVFKIQPVFDVKERGVILVIILLIERSHFYTLCRGCYNVIFPCFSDSSPRPVGKRTMPNQANTTYLAIEMVYQNSKWLFVEFTEHRAETVTELMPSTVILCFQIMNITANGQTYSIWIKCAALL